MTPLESLGVRLQMWRLALLYLCYALPVGAFLIVATPPFQTPDAANHFFRATQVAEGGWLARSFNGTSGGPIDAGAAEFAAIFDPIAHHPEVKLDATMNGRSHAVLWSGHAAVAEFPNTAIYPAYAYAPQVLAIAAGQALHASVRATYLAACAAGLIFSVCLTAWAISLARRSAFVLFAIALLPCTSMLFSSVSQETTVVPLCFLLVAWVDRSIDARIVVSARALVFAALACVVAASARPPYIGLLLIVFTPGLRIHDTRYGFAHRSAWFIATAALAALTTLAFSHAGWAPVSPPRSLGGQIEYLVHAPLAIPHVAFATLKTYGSFYFSSFVGVLGWLDASFRHGYYVLSAIMFGALGFACLLVPGAQSTLRVGDRIVMLGSFVSCAALIFGSLYLTWTPVGNAIVEGVQGRYFIAMAPLLGLALAAYGRRANRSIHTSNGGVAVTLRNVFIAAVLVFPFITFIELVNLVINRYYL
jgi:uncharacterized membrane protein